MNLVLPFWPWDFCPSGDRCSTAPVSSRSQRWFLFQLRPCPHADGTILPKFVFEAPEQVPQGASIRLLTLRVWFQAIMPGGWFREDFVFNSPPLSSVPATTHFQQMHGDCTHSPAAEGHSRAAIEESPPVGNSLVEQRWTFCHRGQLSLSSMSLNAWSTRATGDRHPQFFEWPQVRRYAFPALPFLSALLRSVRLQRPQELLVAPNWPQRPWMAEIYELLEGCPGPLQQHWTLRQRICFKHYNVHF